MAKSPNAVKLTKTAVKDLAPAGRDVVLNDTEVPGLHVRCTSGGSKAFVFFYRVNNRPRKAKIGSWPTMTVDQARSIAREWYVLAGKGIDPVAARKTDGLTVAKAWAEFDANHIAELKPATQKRYRELWRLHIEPEVGRKPLGDLTTEAVELIANRARRRAGERYTAKIEQGILTRGDDEIAMGGAPKRSTEPGAATANRVLNLISRFHVFCGYRGWRPKGDNPSEGITRKTEVARKPRLTDEQVQAIGTAFEKARVRTTPWALGAIKALFFSGHRKQEVFGLRWDALHLDGSEPYADLEDSKTGPRTLPLNAAMVEIIREMETWRSGFPSPFVFQSADPSKPVGDPRKTWEFLKREAKLPWLKMHDFRHVFGTSAVSNGAALDLVQKIMGHADPRTTQRYAAMLIKPAVEASNIISDRLAIQIEKGAKSVRDGNGS